MQELVQGMRSGDRRALARLITLIERGGDQAVSILGEVHPHAGNAYVIGITGPPGAGKSTLVDRLTALYRAQGQTVGILAVDPTSPFTGGAFLGDRVRMQGHYLDPGVFIRSMATRGSSGGLPRMTKSAIRVLDAAGMQVILVETVGVGQTELEVMSAVDTVVVVLVPEAGDAIQTLKAGLLEIADIFVVNKADREGASRLVAELEVTLGLAETSPWWPPPILETQAHKAEGIDLLQQTIQEHREALESSSRLEEKRRARQRREFLKAVEEEWVISSTASSDRTGRRRPSWARWSRGKRTPTRRPIGSSITARSSGSGSRSWRMQGVGGFLEEAPGGSHCVLGGSLPIVEEQCKGPRRNG